MEWTLLWKFLLILTLGGYSLLTLIVVIGGIHNIIDMLRDLTSLSETNSQE
jgi:hypothetical protein